MADSKPTCSVDGCERASYIRGMCNAHYLRWQRHGDPLKGGVPKGRRGECLLHCGKHRECPAAKRINHHLDYVRNSERYKARASESGKKNYPQRRETYFAREDIKERARLKTRQWSHENAERKKMGDAAYRKANRPRLSAHNAKHRAKKRNATPLWLTREMLVAMNLIYAEASRLTLATGVDHEVDHIVPLSAKDVCGLHVPWNLRVLPAKLNVVKSTRWDQREAIDLSAPGFSQLRVAA